MPGPERQKPRRAAALKYEKGAAGAPKVVAAGAGLIAERIVEIAREQGLAVREDPALAEALARLELEQEIPPELFAAVAEVLVWAYGLEAKQRRRTTPR
ncbi:MAG TPA: EscU/YscU/HrcU family type III secretion system export apparatus switch protein [Baekduia sp.]